MTNDIVSPRSTADRQTMNAMWTSSTPRQAKYPAAISEMSSGIGSPNPHRSKMPPSHKYAPSGVMVESWAMNHLTREGTKYHGPRTDDDSADGPGMQQKGAPHRRGEPAARHPWAHPEALQNATKERLQSTELALTL